MAGRLTNMEWLHKTYRHMCSNIIPVDFENYRTMSFDMKTAVLISDKPNIVVKIVALPHFACSHCNRDISQETRKKIKQSIISKANGIIYVADSMREKLEWNKYCWDEFISLETNRIPLVLQYNKRDMPNILTIKELADIFNPHQQYQEYEGIAIKGKGVIESFKGLLQLISKDLAGYFKEAHPKTLP